MNISTSKLNITQVGRGPALVLIHGWGMNSTVWQPIIKKLSKFYRLHLVDLPGMGLSETMQPYTLNSLAEIVADQLPDGVNVLGWSLGGQVALRIALDQPEIVKKLVLVGTTPCFVNVDTITTRPYWHAGVNASVFEKFSSNVATDYQKTMMHFLTLQCLGSKTATKALRQLKKQFETMPVPSSHTLMSALDILLETDLRAEVPNIMQPTFVIHGDKDSLAPVAAANWLAQHIQHALIRVISGASHAPFISHAEEFGDALLNFLAKEDY